MQDQGAGGVGFVSIGINEAVIYVAVLVAAFALWKAATFLRARRSNG